MLQIAAAVQAAGGISHEIQWEQLNLKHFLALGIKTVLQLHFALRKMTQAESIN